jgi:hypothetical protein
MVKFGGLCRGQQIPSANQEWFRVPGVYPPVLRELPCLAELRFAGGEPGAAFFSLRGHRGRYKECEDNESGAPAGATVIGTHRYRSLLSWELELSRRCYG